MEKRKNFTLDTLKYIQCIIEKVKIKRSLFQKIEISDSHIKEWEMKDTSCTRFKVQDVMMRNGEWLNVDLSHTRMENCKVDGLMINGFHISELIESHQLHLQYKQEEITLDV